MLKRVLANLIWIVLVTASLLALAASIQHPPGADASGKVTYLGNEGFFVQTESRRLMFDGLHTVFSTHHSTYLERDPVTGTERNRHVDVQHLVFQVDVDGKRILHTGDLDLKGDNRDYFKHMNLTERGIDLAFLHVRFLIAERNERLISRAIKPGKVIFMHVAPASLSTMQGLGDEVMPGTTIFERPGQVLALE